MDMENEGKDWMWLPRDWRPTLADEFQAWDYFLSPAFIPLTLGISFSLLLWDSVLSFCFWPGQLQTILGVEQKDSQPTKGHVIL